MHDENNEHKPDREEHLRQRIVSLVRENEQALKQQISGKELQTLKNAASRLDQMLKLAAEEERQVLRTAVARLDQWLAEIRRGNDFSNQLKRR